MESDRATARPLVSAIIPTYNRAELLPRALDSAFSQQGQGTLFDLEILVVNDASIDATPEVVRRYPGVRYIRLSEHRGASVARNAGIAASTGTFIAFLDDDDIWLPHRLEVQVPVLVGHPEAGAVYGQVYVPGRLDSVWPHPDRAPSGWIFNALLKGNIMTVHSVLIRRRALEQAGYFDETLSSYEDWDLWLRLSFQVPFLFVPGAVAVYNFSPGGLWLSRVAEGAGAEEAVRVVNRAFRMLPDAAQHDDARRETTARTLLYSATPISWYRPPAETWSRVMATVRQCPGILHYDWARHYVVEKACKQAAPLEAVERLRAEMTSSFRSREEQVRRRRQMGEIWALLAECLASGNSGRDREVAHAAARAVAYMPACLRRKALLRALLRVFIRAIFGRRVDAWCRQQYLRLRGRQR